MKPFLLMSLLLFAASLQAETYRWVDDQGVVTYSQTPPPGQAAERVRTYAASPSSGKSSQTRLNELRQRLADSAEDRELEQAQRQETEEEVARKRQNCEAARSNLRKLEGLGNRLYEQDGEYRRLTEEERQGLMQKEREHIEANCGS